MTVGVGIFKRLGSPSDCSLSFLLHQYLSHKNIYLFPKVSLSPERLNPLFDLISDSLFRYTQDVSSPISQSLLLSEHTLTQHFFISLLSFHYGLYTHSL